MNADTREVAKLTTDDWHNNSLDIVDNSKNEANVDSANIDLAQFGVHIEILLADNVKKTCRRWAVENYTNYSKIDIIKILTTNFRAEISTNKEESILVHHCQIAKIDGLDKGNINNISEDTVAL